MLEGGYSIQGALPYVNLGLCLAMAGVDTSQVREPDYDPKRFVQKQSITDYTHSLAEQLLDYLGKMPSLPDEGKVEGQWFVREQNVYYDTDGITERRKDKVLMCPDCAGTLVIESRSSVKPLEPGGAHSARGLPALQARRAKHLSGGRAVRIALPLRQLMDRADKVYERLSL